MCVSCECVHFFGFRFGLQRLPRQNRNRLRRCVTVTTECEARWAVECWNDNWNRLTQWIASAYCHPILNHFNSNWIFHLKHNKCTKFIRIQSPVWMCLCLWAHSILIYYSTLRSTILCVNVLSISLFAATHSFAREHSFEFIWIELT